MTKSVIFGLLLLVSVCSAQQHYDDPDYQDYQVPAPRVATKPVPRAINRPFDTIQKTTPVPILKQINRHNDDGSYTYGFEAADGTFKIETKYTNGDVKGKYGFVDDTGKVRTVEYGADRYGFQPAGEGITVAPPTLVDESLLEEELEEQRPRPRVQQPLRPKGAPKPRPQPQYQPQPQYIEQPAYDQQINYEVQEAQEPIIPPRAVPVPARPIHIPNAAPVPQRVQIPGAAPVPARHIPPPAHRAPAHAPARPIFANAAPVPPRPQIPGAFQAPDPVRPRQQAPRAGPAHHQPAHQPAFFQAAPAIHHQPVVPVQQPRVYQAPRAAHGSVLDQLAKDYALPQGSAAINDFSFSSGF